jgi:hypothetical protein
MKDPDPAAAAEVERAVREKHADARDLVEAQRRRLARNSGGIRRRPVVGWPAWMPWDHVPV